ncbi:MAG: hypothetical protein GXP39_05605, partial [Chloroflexi bacterium]|nr:hypothetical protein [Chloroflexota bacterium]
RVAYRDDNGHLHTTDSYHYPYIENWLRQAYPVPDVRITEASSVLDASHWVTKGTCSEINSVLADEWTQDGSPADVIYFAISDGIPYGCALMPGNWGTGAAWEDATSGWDFDGSIADWYAGHEIGHTRGMNHVQTQKSSLCGQVAPPPYEPYQAGNGRISPDTTGPGAQYGFNVDTLEIYPYSWKDVMTYCAYKWVSGYTYEKIHDFIVGQTGGAAAQGVRTEGERLLVIGLLDPEEDTARLATVSRVVETWPLTTPAPGPYSLRLLDGGGGILAQHAFTPTLESAGRSVDGGSPRSMGRIYLVVPWVSGTAHIGIWHDDRELAGRDVSAHAPTVTVTYPNGGEVWGSQPVTVTWTANDADGDLLHYLVQYSADGGNTWRVLAGRLSDTFYALNPMNLPGGDQALIRVAANDGVNTGRDVSDATFQVANKPPEARILAPASGRTFVQGQPVILRGVAHDREDGRLTGSSLTWTSDLDGAVGTGRVVVMPSPSVGAHRITFTATDSRGLIATDEVQIEVQSAPSTDCVERLHNGDFESGDLRGWQEGGMPAPFVSDAMAHDGTYALILGTPGELPDRPSLSFVRQYVHVPEDASQAVLSFWYKVRTLDPGTDHDWFGAFVLDPQGKQAHRIGVVNANSDWNHVLYDLRPFAGQTIGIGFFVRNDGQAGQTWAFVDDVSICASGGLPPSKPGACWLSEQPEDYAPAGLPDFDQRQDLWQAPGTGQWSHDGPAAVADLLWWRDSAEEPGTTTPPGISDGYSLVGSYGAWDDHDPQNVPPLIADLAARMNTNGDHPGTDLDDLVNGLNAYLAAKGLADDYTVTVRHVPSFDWVREEVKQNRQVLLLLGFWELQPDGWRRLGGHYVAAAGASCDADRIALSDPFRNYAEAGWSGQVAPSGPHGHAPGPSHIVHNGVAYVSHDVYGVMRTASGWGPQGYARSYAEIANFAGLNFAPALESSRAGAYLGGEVVTLADYALVLAPRSDRVTLKLSPAVGHVRAGETFRVEMEILAGDQPVDGVSAYLNFDPNVLRVVDEEGNPATRVIPGTTLSNVTLNRVIHALGRIDFSAQGDATAGRFTVAIVRFQAITTTNNVPLTWSVTAPRQSDVTSGGGSVLGGLRGGRVVVRPGARLTGRATMQGRPTSPDPSWRVPLLLSLSRPGEPGPAYLYGTASNQNGAFAMPGVAAPGDYRVRLKGLHTLRNLRPTGLSTGINAVDMETLLEGDAYNDNRVDVRDVSVLAAAYGRSQGQPGFDPRADFNEDGVIDQADLTLLRANLGRRGDILVGVTAASAESVVLTPAGPNLTGAVSLRMVPSSTGASIGDIVTIDVVADAGTQPVDAAALHLDFDPTVLEVVDAAGSPATAVEPGMRLPTVLLNSVGPARGWVDFLAGSLGGSPAGGQFLVARLRVRVLAAESTWVRFSFSDWRPTDVMYRGDTVLESVQAAEIRSAGGYSLYLPVILR